MSFIPIGYPMFVAVCQSQLSLVNYNIVLNFSEATQKRTAFFHSIELLSVSQHRLQLKTLSLQSCAVVFACQTAFPIRLQGNYPNREGKKQDYTNLSSSAFLIQFQFPVKFRYAVAINKAQEQSLKVSA